jgi:hypothetical protein
MAWPFHRSLSLRLRSSMIGARPRIFLAADAGPASDETDADGEEAPGARGRTSS